MTKKKYLILFLIIIVLVIIGLSLTNNKKSENFSDENSEKASEGYKIIEDIVILNIDKDDPVLEEGEKLSQKINKKISKLTLFSPDFQNLENIPVKFTCDGDNINPNLEISGVDEKAKSLVLIMNGPDASDETWIHWIKFNIPTTIKNLNEGEEVKGVSGEGTGANLDYSGPCPSDGKHKYIFKLYSIDIELTLAEGSSKLEVEEAIEGHILQETELIGVYERNFDLGVEQQKENEGE